jgi:sugar lactone lactonase YvrE
MIRSILKAEPVVAHLCELGEGPLWDEALQSIHWLDIEKGHIHTFNPATGKLETIEVHQRIGCIALFLGKNEFIGGLENGFATIDRNSGSVKLISDPESNLPGNRFNDGKCDPAGRFWAGTMSLEEESGAGNLYMLDTDTTVTKKLDRVTISNGMAWSADKKKFYYIDTPTKTISAWDFNIKSGTITAKRTIISIPDKEGSPDGMTIDTEGMLWVAHWGGWQVSRWNPATGKKLLSVTVPVKRVTSCTFGGKNLSDLYITSARIGMDVQEQENQPLAGSLFVVKDCGYSGLPAFRFHG